MQDKQNNNNKSNNQDNNNLNNASESNLTAKSPKIETKEFKHEFISKKDENFLKNTYLGKAIKQEGTYNKNLLQKILRNNRSIGLDIWNLYELFWINKETMQHFSAIGILYISSMSKYMVESKSLKLYLNSMHNLIATSEELTNIIEQDLSDLLETKVSLIIKPLEQLREVVQPFGVCLNIFFQEVGQSLIQDLAIKENQVNQLNQITSNIELKNNSNLLEETIKKILSNNNVESLKQKYINMQKDAINYEIYIGDGSENESKKAQKALIYDDNSSDLQQLTKLNFNYTFHLNNIISYCPVTSQPDFATIVLCFDFQDKNMNPLLESEINANLNVNPDNINLSINNTIDDKKIHFLYAIYQYILSKNCSNDFHEAHTQRIYDYIINLMKFCNIKSKVLVFAHYTRRGGIDICPYRANFSFSNPKLIYFNRQ